MPSVYRDLGGIPRTYLYLNRLTRMDTVALRFRRALSCWR